MATTTLGREQTNKESTMEQYKTCIKCGQTQPLDCFRPEKRNKDGKYPYCRYCEKAANKIYREKNRAKEAARKKAYRQANREKVAAYAKAFREANPELVARRFREWQLANPKKIKASGNRRRANKLDAKTFQVTAKDNERILAKPCIYCGAPSKHIDHIIPLSRGGDHSLGNLVGACQACNLSKKDKTIMEWRVWRLKLGL